MYGDARLPINWLLGALIMVIACVVGIGVWVLILVTRVVRRQRWPVELRRRRALPLVMAHVESFMPITEEAGRIVLTIEERVDGGYREPQRVRLKAIVHLPAGAMARVEAGEKIPVRFDTASPSHSAVDVGALTGANADDEERRAFVARGPTQWEHGAKL